MSERADNGSQCPGLGDVFDDDEVDDNQNVPADLKFRLSEQQLERYLNGQAQPHTHTINWQIGLNSRGLIYDLHLSIDSCGPKREWLIVQSKSAKGKAAAKGKKCSNSFSLVIFECPSI